MYEHKKSHAVIRTVETSFDEVSRFDLICFCVSLELEDVDAVEKMTGSEEFGLLTDFLHLFDSLTECA